MPFRPFVGLAFLWLAGAARGQEKGHPLLDRLWLSAQANINFQSHPSFRSLYSGGNSLPAEREFVTSSILTLYTGLRLTESTSLIVHAEHGSGRNFNSAAGLANGANIDNVGIPDSRPYLARLLLQQTIGFSRRTVEMSRGPLQLSATAPARRLDFYIGKLAVQDFFDVNAVGGDNQYQFTNGGVLNNSTYGYPGDTRSYTWGFLAEYHHDLWTLRVAELLQPRLDAAHKIDFKLSRQHTEHVEAEIPTRFVKGHVGFVRALAFFNYSPLGRFRDAIAAADADGGIPDLEAVRRPGWKQGYGIGVEQELNRSLRVYGRAGWAEGRKESIANTQSNSAFSGGFDYTGRRWKREDDRFGLAVASSGLSLLHRTYLARGGLGGVLGDGQLTYGRETVFEIYYAARVAPGVYATLDLQRITNPANNRDRGPVNIFTLRLHLEGALRDQPR